MIKRIVIVEDEELIAEWIKMLIQDKLPDAEFILISSFKSAEQFIKYYNNKIDLVLTDNHLGDGEGVNLIKKWKTKFNTTVIMVSSADMNKKASKQGADGFIYKNFFESRVESIIKNI